MAYKARLVKKERFNNLSEGGIVRELPIYQIKGKKYFLDNRLGEYRNVNDPSDIMKVENVTLEDLEKPSYQNAKKYDVYADPSHAWAKVKLSELKRLGIADKITPYSYQRGNYVYLEEDNDLTLFINAKKEKGEEVSFNEHTGDKSSKIRSYPPYKYQTEEEEKETERLREDLLNSRAYDWSEKAKRKIKNASRETLLYWKEKN